MKCSNCGFESEQSYPVCPQCQMETQPNPAAQKILSVLKDPLFLVICILMSVVSGLPLMSGRLEVIDILITVFLWLVYAQSRKGIADVKHLRCVSGTVYADYVITYVAAGLVLVLGMIFTVAFGVIASTPAFFETLLSGYTDTNYAALAQAIASISSGVILFAFLLAAAIIVVLNIFSTRYFHRFAKSVYQSIGSGTLDLKHTTATKIWLFIFGGLAGLSCLSSLAGGQLLPMLSSGAGSAASIFAGILIHKYLSDESAAPALPRDSTV